MLAFAAWTVIYQACLVARVESEWAVAAEVVALGPCLALAFAGGRDGQPAPDAPEEGGRRWRGARPLLAVATLIAAVAFAFVDVPWTVVIVAWLVAAGVALVSARGRAGAAAGEGTAVALGWAVGLAALSLFLVNPNSDDGEYVHLSSWVAAHGSFPLRDTLFSDQALPAIFYPPLSSFEALVGSFARTAGLQASDVVYFVAPPAAAALAVLALWRLLRGWRVAAPALALSLAVAFLLLDAARMRALGSFWLARLWQGKVVFVAVLVPLLFALLHEYAERPTRRGLVLLAAAGVAGVGLTTSAIFVVPLVALGCLAPLLPATPRRAAAALAATAGYPLAAGAATLALGGRNPQVYTAAEVVPRTLAHDVLGRGPVAFVALAAVLAGPALIRSAAGARMAAGVVLTVGLAFVPGVTLALFRLTGLGEVLWRLTWALPVAALVGVLGSEALRGSGRVTVRALPAVAVAAALLAFGTPVWSAAAGTGVAESPTTKVDAVQLDLAREVLAAARPGDVVLAPRATSRALLELSGSVVVVDPSDRYVRALRGVRGAFEGERLVLEDFGGWGQAPLARSLGHAAAERRVGRALRELRVDLACVRPREAGALALLARHRFVPAGGGSALRCLRRPAGPLP